MFTYLFNLYNYCMKASKKKYIAAVSGGPDSMALLDKFKKQIRLVCHVNYHKRTDSDHDEQIVRQFCKKFGIALRVLNVTKDTYKKAKEHNFQALARQIRYDFFVECGQRVKCHNLLIAHNLNDFIETALMQQNRKSKNFFYGIKQETQYKSLEIYRPLLKEFKSDLEQYCIDHNIDYAIDSSNASDIYERNRIRKQLAKLSRKQILDLYKEFENRNRKQEKLEQEVTKLLIAWQKTKYAIKYFQNVKPKFADSLIYLYLKNNNIATNYNKIKLVRDYIVSKKSNNSLRLEDGIKLVKKDKKVKLVKEK